jgi:putative oxygen-independent coproporphyrinogen III oxidase
MSSSLLQNPPLSLYVHMPWCVAKCPYCDFNSHVAPASLPQDAYIDCLLSDLELDLAIIGDRTIETIFFGGGTPSLFSPPAIERLLAGVRQRMTVAPDAEVTLEANPGAIEHGSFVGYREAGITRVSLGVQSLNAGHLRALGRIHGPEHVAQTVAELRAAQLDNFNLDLMYGLPGQTLAEACDDLRRVVEFQPAHISQYQLTLEPGTVFYHRPPSLPHDDLIWEMQEASQAMFADAGYEQYEISAYAQSGRQCRHNLNYWRFGDYLGIGAGAHGKFTLAHAGEIWRTARQKQPREYMNARTPNARVVEKRLVATDELPFEFALNALRLKEPFSLRAFELRTGISRSKLAKSLSSAQEKRLIDRICEDRWQVTPMGHRFLNDLQSLFLA